MTISSEPTNNGLYFQKNIPDIILIKTTADLFVTFELKKDNVVILLEKYTYDVDGKINIRNLFEVLENYLSDSVLMASFSYTITEGATPHTRNFKVIKCDADASSSAADFLKKSFLSRHPGNKVTARYRKEYLSYFQTPAMGIVTVNRAISYVSNGSVLVMNSNYTIPAVTVDTIQTIETSIDSIYNFPYGTVIHSYMVEIVATGVASIKFGYLVDNNFYRYFKNFVFTNCFGVLETFTATGLQTNAKTGEFNFANIAKHYKKITQEFVSEKSVFSGFVDSYCMDWADDLLRSYNVALYSNTSNVSTSIVIVEIDKTDTEANELCSFSFKYRKAKNDHVVLAENTVFDFTFDTTFE